MNDLRMWVIKREWGRLMKKKWWKVENWCLSNKWVIEGRQGENKKGIMDEKMEFGEEMKEKSGKDKSDFHDNQREWEKLKRRDEGQGGRWKKEENGKLR